jgi:pentatricopeptide repeat protein
MLLGNGRAPAPRADTFNSMIRALASRREPYTWVLKEMAQAGVAPDALTVGTLIKLQPTIRSALGIWHWGRRRGAACGTNAWHHLIESHVRLGRPSRVRVLLALMEARDGLSADTTMSHNLYLRALIAEGKPDAALAHFERMCTETTDEGEVLGDAAGLDNPASVPPWLRRPAPPSDSYSFSLALTALRQIDDLAIKMGAKPTDRMAGASSSARAERAAAIFRDAEQRGIVPGDAPLAPAVAHSLVSACGDDVRAAVSLWKDFVRPRALRARAKGEPLYAAAGEQPTAEQASYHALLRVCGAAGRADEALKIVYAMRQDGLPTDPACYTAYDSGLQSTNAMSRATGPVQLLRAGYERLLMMELCPERVQSPRLGGKIDRIRIQLDKP